MAQPRGTIECDMKDFSCARNFAQATRNRNKERYGAVIPFLDLQAQYRQIKLEIDGR
jgi:hypothetical protein